jgi:hypothetical protein
MRVQQEFIQPVEPSHLKKFFAGYVKHERRDPETEQLREHDDENGADEVFMGEQPQANHLQRK